MMKLSRMAPHDKEQGFTLVEVIVALVLLLLIVTACFPLFSMAAKVTQQNRVRLVASELAKRELEDTLGRVTPANYNNENDSDPGGAPLKITTGNPDTLWVAIPGTNLEMRKIVRWVDDPADGLGKGGGKVDKLPFDYKEIIIEVRCPSVFTGSIQVQADFKDFVAREGTSFPFTGIVVEVVRGWTDNHGERIPVPGATVTITGTSDTRSTITNAQGQALFPVTFPSGSYTPRTYTVTTLSAGMITRPDQQDVSVVVHPFSNSSLQVEVDRPASLTLQFTPCSDDVAVVLDGGSTMGYHTQTLTAGQTEVTFLNLWPAGTDPSEPMKACAGGFYSLQIPDEILICRYDVSDPSLTLNEDDYQWHQKSTSSEKNLWKYDSTDQAWVASQDNYDPGTTFFGEGKHRVAYPEDDDDLFDGREFRPASSNITATLIARFVKPGTSGEAWLSLSGYSNWISAHASGEKFNLFYLGKDNASLPSDPDWTPLLSLIQNPTSGEIILIDAGDNKVADEDSGQLLNPLDCKFNNTDVLDTPFRLRFDSDPSFDKYIFRYFELAISYQATGIQFSQPGDNRTLRVNGS